MKSINNKSRGQGSGALTQLSVHINMFEDSGSSLCSSSAGRCFTVSKTGVQVSIFIYLCLFLSPLFSVSLCPTKYNRKEKKEKKGEKMIAESTEFIVPAPGPSCDPEDGT